VPFQHLQTLHLFVQLADLLLEPFNPRRDRRRCFLAIRAVELRRRCGSRKQDHERTRAAL
jgi:hypothetical protein